MVCKKLPQIIRQIRIRGNQFVRIARLSVRCCVEIIGDRAFQSPLVVVCLRIIRLPHTLSQRVNGEFGELGSQSLVDLGKLTPQSTQASMHQSGNRRYATAQLHANIGECAVLPVVADHGHALGFR
jgi:hypothetical protein